MSDKIEAGNEFLSALAEVDSLIAMARLAGQSKDEDTYSLFLKCALLLLMAKFECFLEELASEYVEFLRRLNPRRSELPMDISINYAICRLRDLESLYKTHKSDEYPKRLEEISDFGLIKTQLKFKSVANLVMASMVRKRLRNS